MMLKLLITSFLVIDSCYLTVSFDPQCNITNLAVNKTSFQNTTYDDKSKSGNAVDGNFTSASRTEEKKDQWLRIDLGQSYSIGVVELYINDHELSKISLLTSNDANVSAPSLVNTNDRIFNNPWKEQAYRKIVKDEVGTIQLQSIYGRHLAIFSSDTLGISIVEMMVFSDMCYNLAEIKDTSQSSTMKSNVSKYGNDGCLSTFSITNEEDRQYWRVSLGAKHVIYKVVIHTKASVYGNWAIITNDKENGADPNCTGDIKKREWSDGWQEVSFISTTRETNDINFLSVSVQHVAVFNVESGKGIVLGELQVFGCQCELQDIARQFKIEPSQTAGCVTLSWSITHQYCSPSVFKYKYQCQGENETVSESPKFSGDVCYSTYGTLVTCNVSACLGSYCYTNKIHASTSHERYEMELTIVSAVESTIIFVAIIVIAFLCRYRTRNQGYEDLDRNAQPTN